jgi:hypothetical protein
MYTYILLRSFRRNRDDNVKVYLQYVRKGELNLTELYQDIFESSDLLSMAINLYSFLNQSNLFLLLHDLITYQILYRNFETDSSTVAKVPLRCIWRSSTVPVISAKCLICSTLTFCTVVSVQNVSGFWPRTVPFGGYRRFSTHDVTVWKVKTAGNIHCVVTVHESVCYGKCLMFIQDIYLILSC